MSAESSKSVERFDCTNGGTSWCHGCYTMTPDSGGEYVRHDDYAKLGQQRDALVEALMYVERHLRADDFGNWCLTCEFDGDRVLAALRAAGVEL